MRFSSKVRILFLFLLALTQGVSAQPPIRVIDNKGTINDIYQYWTKIGSSGDIHNTNTGNVGIGTGATAPAATLHNAGSTILGSTDLSNFTTSTTLPALSTVDAFSGAVVTQTTAGVTLTLPIPSNTTAGRIFQVSNSKTLTSVPITVGGANASGDITLAPGSSTLFRWDGLKWSPMTAANATNDWHLTGNSGTNPGTAAGQNFLGTTDPTDLVFGTQGTEKMRLFSLNSKPALGLGETDLSGVNGGASTWSGPTLFLGTEGNIASKTGLDIIIDADKNATNSSFRIRANGDGAPGTLDLVDVEETGNVGIGIVNPAHKLDVGGDINFTGALMVGASANPGTSGQILQSNGTAAPSWVTLSGLPSTAGILPIANGGTGLSAMGTPNQVLAVNSGGTALNWVTPTTGTVTSITTNSGLTGGPITTSGTIGIATNGVTSALFRQSTANTLVGNPTGATANVTDITLGSGLSFSGATLTNSGILSVTGTAPITASTTSGATTIGITRNNIVTGTSSGTATSPLTLDAGATNAVVGGANATLTVNNTAPLWNANQVNSANVPVSASYLGSNSSGQLVSVSLPSSVTSLTGTANQVLVNNTSGTATTGAVTLTLPQNIGTSNSPSFTGLTLSGLTANTLLYANNSKAVSSVTLGSGLSFDSSTGTLSATGGSSTGWLLGGNDNLTITNSTQSTLGSKTGVNFPLKFIVGGTQAGYLGTSTTSATAFGYQANAVTSTDNTTAIGANAQATAQYATAIGANSVASNNPGATAVGYQASAQNNYATAIGANSSAVAYSTALGANADGSKNQYSTVIGYGASTTGQYGIAIGYNTQQVGQSAIGIGSAVTSAMNSVAIGSGGTEASGYTSTAIGNVAKATTNNSLAIGNNTNATGQQSTALGYNSSVSGQNSTGIGFGAKTTQDNTLILGNTSGGTATKVGIGTATPGNALEVSASLDPLKLGGLQTTTNPTYLLGVDGSGVVKTVSASSGVPISSLLAATGTNDIDNKNNAQIWRWNTVSTQTPLALSADFLTSGTLLNLSSTNSWTTGSLLNVSSSSQGGITNGLVNFNFTGAHTGNGVNITDATTSGNAMQIKGNAITTGSLINATSSSTVNTGTNGLLYVANLSSSTTGVVAKLQANSSASGSGMTVLANGNVGVGLSASSTPASDPTFTKPGNSGASIPTLGVDGTVNATNYTSPVKSLGTTSSISWDLSTGANATVTLGASAPTLSLSNLKPGMYGTLIITNGSTAQSTISFGASTSSNGSIPAGNNKVINGGLNKIYLTSATNAVDIACFFFDGTYLYWTIGNNYN